MTTDVARAYRQYDAARIALEVFTMLIVLAMMGVLIKVALVNQENGRLLVECTTDPALREPPVRNPKPSDCYVRDQARQAGLVGDPEAPINNVVILASACARQPTNDTAREIQDCVVEGLAEAKRLKQSP